MRKDEILTKIYNDLSSSKKLNDCNEIIAPLDYDLHKVSVDRDSFFHRCGMKLPIAFCFEHNEMTDHNVNLIHSSVGGYNFVDSNGNLIFDVWFDSFSNFIEGERHTDDLLIVHKGSLTNAVVFSKNGLRLVSDCWFDDIKYSLHPGILKIAAKSKSVTKFNFINTKTQKLLSDVWFDAASDFKYFNNKYANVFAVGIGWTESRFIGKDGKLLLKDRFYDDEKIYADRKNLLYDEEQWNKDYETIFDEANKRVAS